MTTDDDPVTRGDGERLSDRQDLAQPAAGTIMAVVENDDVRYAAAGNLGFLLSVIRCGEQLSADEEACIRKTIARLDASLAAGNDSPAPLKRPA